jgi:Phytanoyl-CoA dioxygenase (PhyH)
MIARLIPSEKERVAGVLKRETIEQASRSFRKDGALLIETIVNFEPIVSSPTSIRRRIYQVLHRTRATALWLGSHRDKSRASNEESIKPVVREGSCLLWDFRLRHGGTPNRGSLSRPLLYLTYCRPWFVDHKNFSENNPKQKPLLASKAFLSGLSQQHQRWMARVKDEAVAGS